MSNTKRVNKENKPRRVPVSGLRDILAVFGKDPAFVYRLIKDVNENGARIQQFIRGGYTLTEAGKDSDITVGEECVYQSKTRKGGSIVAFPAGEGAFLYLVQIKKEWYDEDQEAKYRQIDEVEAQITGKHSEEDNELGQYGDIKINDGMAKREAS